MKHLASQVLVGILAWVCVAVSAPAQSVNSFDGIAASQLARPGFLVDANGAVGTKQYMEYSSIYYQAYDKVTFASVWANPQQINTPFLNNGLNNCSNITGDGYIIFDRLASRWVLSAHTGTQNNYFYCIAVSNTDDLTASNLLWFTYEIPLNPVLGTNSQGNVYFPDWPKLGTWPDAYYVGIDLNDINQNFREVGVLACALDRSTMLTGGIPRSPQCFRSPNPVPTTVYLGHSLIPADVDGTTAPPVGRDEYFVSIQNPPIDQTSTTSNTINLWDFHVDWSNPANSTFTQSSMSVAQYEPGCYETTDPVQTVCVPEPTTVTTGQHIDSVGDRLMPRLAYRNFGAYESFLFSHAVQVGTGLNGQTGIRWYELRGSGAPTVFRYGNISPDNTTYRFMSSMAQDQNANAALGYSVSSGSLHPGISASSWSLANNTLPIEFSILNGVADEENTWHWGSYTTMSVDPVDGCTFWYPNEYFPTNQIGANNAVWVTRIANFKLPSCGTVAPSPNSLTFASQAIGTTSAPQAVTLYNGQTVALNIASFTFAGANASDFAQTNTCGSTLAAGQACTVNVTFTPSATGTRTATMNVNDDAGNSPQTVSLTGTGSAGGPLVVLAPTSMAFGNESVGVVSPAQMATLTNTGNATLTITSLAVTGLNKQDFPQTNNCPSSVAAGGSCTISVTFDPTATGPRKASVTVNDNAPGSPQSISLTGTGVKLTVTVSPTTLSFGKVNLHVTSPGKIVTLTNTSTSAVTITGITVTGTNAGDFGQTNPCGTSLGAGANCQITVTFAPTALGQRTASLSIADNASGSPQMVSLSGFGVQPVVNLSPTTLQFPATKVGTTSAPKNITLTNTGLGNLTISQIRINGTNAADFAQTNNCGANLAAGGSCMISVTFTPKATGVRRAAVTITDNASNSPQSVNISGSGD
jgi:Abnormal spindle-like microcephaly-assoc'd, ASPM-SPD-2-Hydin